MEYWKHEMWWKITEGWECVICDHRGLTWGMVKGECRCDRCHTIYTMQTNGKKLKAPACLLREEWVEPYRQKWQKWGVPLDELTEEQWEEENVILDG